MIIFICLGAHGDHDPQYSHFFQFYLSKTTTGVITSRQKLWCTRRVVIPRPEKENHVENQYIHATTEFVKETECVVGQDTRQPSMMTTLLLQDTTEYTVS